MSNFNISSLIRTILAPLSGLLSLYGLWAFAAYVMDNPVLMPGPAAVLAALFSILAGDLIGDIGASLLHLSYGMVIGVSIGLLLAFIATASRTFEILIDPLIELLRPISGIAWIPLAIMMFGIGETVPIFLIAYVSVFPIYVNTVTGIKGVDRRLIDAARVLGAKENIVRFQIILPAALPMILTGFRLSLGVAWMTLIGAELIGGNSGLGWRAFWYEQFFAMNKTFAIIVVVGILGFTIDGMIRLLQARLTNWAPASEDES